MNFAIDTFDNKRRGLITGSKCSVIFPGPRGGGKDGQITYAKQLAKEKFFNFYDETSSWQTEHGKMAEHFAFEHYQTYYDDRIQPGRFILKGECAGTIDAEVPKIKGIDFKCSTSLQGWLDYLFVGIDKEQFHQCQMYMYLTGYPVWEIAAYLTETQFMTDNGLVYPVEESKRMIIVMVEKDETWEAAMEENKLFIIEQRDLYMEKLKERFHNV